MLKMKELIWEPSEERKKQTNMFKFINYINDRRDKDFKDYDHLYDWSIKNIPEFWESLWDFMDIKYSKIYDQVLVNGDRMPGAKWFVGAELNFAENLLRYRDDRPALIFKGETTDTLRISYAELYDMVARLAKSLREMGIKKGDRVVGFMPNLPETIVAMLAATSIGALWSSCSPDFGVKGMLDRFSQIEPRIIFTTSGYSYNGKVFNPLDRFLNIMHDLPSLEKVVVVPFIEKEPDISAVQNAVLYGDFISKDNDLNIEFEQLPFEHPLYIMYSSGTTGLPKCMVQSAGGILVQQMKELMLHTDVKREDKIFYFTTCGWMMWNWLTSALSLGATIILFDGSPFYPDPGVLFKLAEDVGMTIFGTSARYISAISKEGLKPSEAYDLQELKALLSTGSPLTADGFEYVYHDIKSDICLSSISGGSDINGCFAGGNPMGPVHVGELQCRTLAMKVEAFDEDGRPVKEKKGELVCAAPLLMLWG